MAKSNYEEAAAGKPGSERIILIQRKTKCPELHPAQLFRTKIYAGICSGQNNPSQVTVCYSVIKPCQLLVTPWTAAHQPSPSFTVSQNLLKLMSTRPVMLCKHLILRRPLLLLPSILPRIGVFSNKSVLHIRWPKYLRFSFSISPSKWMFKVDFL